VLNAGSESVGNSDGVWDSSWASLQGGMVQLYTRSAPRTIHQFWHRCYFEDLWALMGSRAVDARYLEIGAGRGSTSMYLASKGCDVTMLDLSSTGFEVARANFARGGLRRPMFVEADARQTNLPPESFDCVLSIGLLEHFEDPRPVIVESMRLLRPGGLQFAVIIPKKKPSVRYLSQALLCPWVLAYELMPEAIRDGIRRLRGQKPAAREAEVLRTEYSRSEYLKMLAGLGAVDVRCVPYNPYHPVYGREALDASITIPLYRLHRSIKRLYANRPLTATGSGLGSCDLLTFRKRS
jgi:2-polyprenyl-3-methyl-5-hydroxy-6-metoxy-1,4-benzoquinol methylase